jgi:hypothetical protein
MNFEDIDLLRRINLAKNTYTKIINLSNKERTYYITNIVEFVKILSSKTLDYK